MKFKCTTPEDGCNTGFNATVVAVIEVCIDSEGNYIGLYNDDGGGNFDPFNGHIEIEKILDVQCGCCGSPGEADG